MHMRKEPQNLCYRHQADVLSAMKAFGCFARGQQRAMSQQMSNTQTKATPGGLHARIRLKRTRTRCRLNSAVSATGTGEQHLGCCSTEYAIARISQAPCTLAPRGAAPTAARPRLFNSIKPLTFAAGLSELFRMLSAWKILGGPMLVAALDAGATFEKLLQTRALGRGSLRAIFLQHSNRGNGHC